MKMEADITNSLCDAQSFSNILPVELFYE